jgi:molecular chaperone Hsp33
MSESAPVNPADAGIEAQTHFVRHRNVLLARANLTDLFVDFHLHLADHRIEVAEAHGTLFKRALAAFVLHQVSRPWNEMTAWTLHFQEPRVNVFLTGDNETGAITGRIFDEHVRDMPENLFFADVVVPRQPKRRSAVPFAGADPLAALETFYAQSEQRVGRVFDLGGDRFALAAEHPDCDVAWLRGLAAGDLATLDTAETLALLEKRIYRWHCGCNQARMLEVLAPTFRADPEDLFGGGETVEIRCPRCGARHTVTREALEAEVARR